jgi:hypothetical protein
VTGRLVFADVPHRADPTAWVDPLLVGSNAALYLLNLAVGTSSTVRFREPFVSPETETRGRPVIYLAWHRLNYAMVPALLTLPPAERPTLLMHDGVASRAFSHRSCVWMGFEAFAFRRRSPVSPREQIAQYVRSTGRSILNLPDSGGPYGVVKPGILEVARACNAWLAPFQVTVEPALHVGKTLRHVIPLPFSRVEVRRGPLLDGATATVDECQRAMDALA